MSIYEIILYITLLLALFPKVRNNVKSFAVLVIILAIIAAIRGFDVGIDTVNYYNTFNSTANVLTDEKQISQFIFYRFTYLTHKYLNYDMYMIIVYSLIMWCYYYSIKKNSCNLLFSLFLIVSCGYYTNSFNVMRQFMAIAIMFVAMSKLEIEKTKRGLIWYGGLLALSTFIHTSSLLLAPLALYKFYDLKKYLQTIIVLISFVLGFFLSDYLTPFFVSMSGDIGYLGSYLLYEGEGGGRNFFSNFGVNVMFLASLFLVSEEGKKSIFFKSYFISMIVFNLVGSMYYMTRLSDYYSIAQVICLPAIIRDYNNRQDKSKIFLWGFVILVVVYSIMRFYMKNLYFFLPYSVRDIAFLI